MKNKKNNAILYIALTYGFTWLFQFMPLVMGWDIGEASSTTAGIASVFYTIGGVMPTLIAIIMVLATYNRPEKLDYFKRAIKVSKAGIRFTAQVLALTIFQTMLSQGIARAFWDAQPFGFTGFQVLARAPYMVFVYLFFGLITNGPFNEEFGWRGYLLDKLLANHGVVYVSLMVGLVWGVWHLPLYFYPLQGPHQMWQLSPLLGAGFIVECITAALVYTVVYIMSDRSILAILFVHMFFNIVKTGIFIYPWSAPYEIILTPVSILTNILYFVIIYRTKAFKHKLKAVVLHLQGEQCDQSLQQ